MPLGFLLVLVLASCLWKSFSFTPNARLRLRLGPQQLRQWNSRLWSQGLSEGTKNTTQGDNRSSSEWGSLISSETWGGMAPLVPELEPNTLDIMDDNAPITKMDTASLMNMWIDICVENSRPDDMNNFSLRTILPKLLREDAVLELYSEGEDDEGDVKYITEQELQRIWNEASHTAMGKPPSSFSVEEALLLLPDKEADDLMFHDEGQSLAADAAALLENEDTELYVTDQELQAVWNSRGEVQWGMPDGKEKSGFDAELALLLLDAEDDDEIDEFDRVLDSVLDGEEDEAEDEDEEDMEGDVTDVDGADEREEQGVGASLALPEDEELAASLAAGGKGKDFVDKKYRSKSDAFLRNAIRRAFAALDINEYLRPAWKKTRHILTPDIDTQNAMVDIMNSNLYMTTRIPANWNDPELEEMSQTYLECGTMAWPGEDETDFNVVVPMWQLLNLPTSPAGMLNTVLSMSNERGEDFDATLRSLDMVVSEYERRAAGIEVMAPIVTTPGQSQTGYSWDEVDAKSGVDNSEGGGAVDDDALDVDEFFSKLGGGGGSAADEEDEDEEDDGPGKEITSPLEPSQLDPKLKRKPKFVTPAAWADENPDFADHVDFNTWSKYFVEEEEAILAASDGSGSGVGPLHKEWYAADDSVWVDDLVVAESVAHLLTITDEYLTDHTALSEAVDDLKQWRRAMAYTFTGGDEGEYDKEEAIPSHLTPDAEEGIEYSDEVIEMKSKVTLAAKLPPPAELFKNDQFDHSTDATVINKVGTVREQYDWMPLERDEPFLIEDHILAKIGPVLRYCNHAADLLSTRDNVLVFDYRGQMRHIVGARAAMIELCKQCAPEIVDIRLETERGSDKFDGAFPETK